MTDPQAALGGARPVGDAISIGVAVATVADWLPAVAALLTIVWTIIRIYETRTVQRLLRRRGDQVVAIPGSPDERAQPDGTADDRLK